jgi:very-short-patch-repair endonuclease
MLKICSNCNKEFQTRIRMGDIIRNMCNRKYCLTCSPFGKHNTKRIGFVSKKEKAKIVKSLCPYCGTSEFSSLALGGHVVWCEQNPNRQQTIKKIKISNTGKSVSDATREKIRKSLGKFFAANDRNGWTNAKNKKESEPEKRFRVILQSLGLDFEQFYKPEDSKRQFRFDFAFPKEKIAIELNGKQHYNSDGSLKEYYQNRHNYLSSLQWNISEIYYSECFDDDNIRRILSLIYIDKLKYSSDISLVSQKMVRAVSLDN